MKFRKYLLISIGVIQMLGAFFFGYAYPRAASTIDAAEINLITLYRDQRVLAPTPNELVEEEIINLQIQLWIARLTQTARGVLDSRESLFNTLFLSGLVVFLIGLTVPIRRNDNPSADGISK